MEENHEKALNEQDEEDLETIKENEKTGELHLTSETPLIEDSEEAERIEENIETNLIDKTPETKILDEDTLKNQVRIFHRNLIEASLYAAGSPLTIEEISTKLELTKKEVEELVNEVAFDYLERPTSLVIAQIGERYQMQIRPEYTEKVSKFAKGGAIAERYLRTLTVIALKQPILKSMVIKLRGTGAYEHVKYLIDNGFINAVKKGRSQELTTTDKYADMFGLPKNRTELKRAMINQLGIEETTSSGPQEDNTLSNDTEPPLNEMEFIQENEEGEE
ncbi:MAG: SMC-Scp complex subunit ScpB [Candidatus Thorarchaeota archaeon]